MKTLTNAELRQAINDTIKNMKPATNGFGHKYQLLDDETLAILRGHLLELHLIESERAKTMAVAVHGLNKSKYDMYKNPDDPS